MQRIDPKDFLAVAVRQGWVDAATAGEVREQLIRNPDLLVCEALRSAQGMDDDKFLRLLSAEVQSEYLPQDVLGQMDIPQEFIDRVGVDGLSETGVVPLAYDQASDKLLVLSAYPFSAVALEELPEFFHVANVELAFAMEGTVHGMIDTIRKRAAETIGDTSQIGHTDDAGYLGADTEEDAFPGLYTQSFSDTLFEEVEAMESTPTRSEDTGPHGVQGNLEDLGLMDMLQTLSQSRKTVTIKLTHERAEAYVFLVEGLPVHCLYGGRTGADAFYALLHWTKGYFNIQPGAYDGAPTIKGSMDGLILEGLRRMDEEGK